MSMLDHQFDLSIALIDYITSMKGSGVVIHVVYVSCVLML